MSKARPSGARDTPESDNDGADDTPPLPHSDLTSVLSDSILAPSAAAPFVDVASPPLNSESHVPTSPGSLEVSLPSLPEANVPLIASPSNDNHLHAAATLRGPPHLSVDSASGAVYAHPSASPSPPVPRSTLAARTAAVATDTAGSSRSTAAAGFNASSVAASSASAPEPTSASSSFASTSWSFSGSESGVLSDSVSASSVPLFTPAAAPAGAAVMAAALRLLSTLPPETSLSEALAVLRQQQLQQQQRTPVFASYDSAFSDAVSASADVTADALTLVPEHAIPSMCGAGALLVPSSATRAVPEPPYTHTHTHARRLRRRPLGLRLRRRPQGCADRIRSCQMCRSAGSDADGGDGDDEEDDDDEDTEYYDGFSAGYCDGRQSCLRRGSRSECYSLYCVTKWRVTRAVIAALLVLLASLLLHAERDAIHTHVQSVQSLLTRVKPGVELARAGFQAHHPVVIIPGIVSTGLEVWQAEECAAGLFRQRIWGSTVMVQTILLNPRCWIDHMRLNLTTGLDPEGIKLRAAQGLEAADYLLPGFWIWARAIEDLAAIGYDSSSLALLSYDWRLPYPALEIRDGYFSRLKSQIEVFRATSGGRKVVLLAHSMGSAVVQYFLRWVEAPQELGGAGAGPDWVARHLESVVHLGGAHLGVPKAVSAMISGEMRDTAEMSVWLAGLRRRTLMSNIEMAGLFRGFPSVPSLYPKGGDGVWGGAAGADAAAPDESPMRVGTCVPSYADEFLASIAAKTSGGVAAAAVENAATVAGAPHRAAQAAGDTVEAAASAADAVSGGNARAGASAPAACADFLCNAAAAHSGQQQHGAGLKGSSGSSKSCQPASDAGSRSSHTSCGASDHAHEQHEEQLRQERRQMRQSVFTTLSRAAQTDYFLYLAEHELHRLASLPTLGFCSAAAWSTLEAIERALDEAAATRADAAAGRAGGVLLAGPDGVVYARADAAADAAAAAAAHSEEAVFAASSGASDVSEWVASRRRSRFRRYHRHEHRETQNDEDDAAAAAAVQALAHHRRGFDDATVPAAAPAWRCRMIARELQRRLAEQHAEDEREAATGAGVGAGSDATVTGARAGAALPNPSWTSLSAGAGARTSSGAAASAVEVIPGDRSAPAQSGEQQPSVLRRSRLQQILETSLPQAVLDAYFVPDAAVPPGARASWAVVAFTEMTEHDNDDGADSGVNAGADGADAQAQAPSADATANAAANHKCTCQRARSAKTAVNPSAASGDATAPANSAAVGGTDESAVDSAAATAVKTLTRVKAAADAAADAAAATASAAAAAAASAAAAAAAALPDSLARLAQQIQMLPNMTLFSELGGRSLRAERAALAAEAQRMQVDDIGVPLWAAISTRTAALAARRRAAKAAKVKAAAAAEAVAAAAKAAAAAAGSAVEAAVGSVAGMTVPSSPSKINSNSDSVDGDSDSDYDGCDCADSQPESSALGEALALGDDTPFAAAVPFPRALSVEGVAHALLPAVAPAYARFVHSVYALTPQKEHPVVPPAQPAAAANDAAAAAVATETAAAAAGASTNETELPYAAQVVESSERTASIFSDPAKLEAQRGWSDPLLSPLPNAPDMKMYSIYGVGKPAERGYMYRLNPNPLERRFLPYVIDTRVSDAGLMINRGVRVTDGDGTVPLLSLGYMCARGGGWDPAAHPHLNPSAIPCTVREYVNRGYDSAVEAGFDVLRLSANSGDHVDLIGNVDVITDMLKIVGRFKSSVRDEWRRGQQKLKQQRDGSRTAGVAANVTAEVVADVSVTGAVTVAPASAEGAGTVAVSAATSAAASAAASAVRNINGFPLQADEEIDAAGRFVLRERVVSCINEMAAKVRVPDLLG